MAQAIAHFLQEPLDSEGYGRTLILLGNSYLQTQQNDLGGNHLRPAGAV